MGSKVQYLIGPDPQLTIRAIIISVTAFIEKHFKINALYALFAGDFEANWQEISVGPNSEVRVTLNRGLVRGTVPKPEASAESVKYRMWH